MAGQDKLSEPVLKLIRRNAWIAVAALLIALTLASLWERANAPPALAIGGPFTLTDQAGRLVSDKTFRGKIEVIYFGFTHCPDACPTSLSTIGAAMKKLGPDRAKQIQTIFITLDPERDTPPVMAEYVNYFVPGMEGLTGTPKEIADVARSFRVAYQKVKDPNSDQPYTIDHMSIIYIMDRQNRYLKHFTQGVTADQLAKALSNAL